MHSRVIRLLRFLFSRPGSSAEKLTRPHLLGLVAAFLIIAPIVEAAQTSATEPPVNGRSQNFDFLILALSWSPTYCASSAKRGETAQCLNPANRGFVVHGLWPQARDGARLRCESNKDEFSKVLFERTLEVFPDLRLAQNQWQRHGHCFGFAADAYLEIVAKAKAKIVIPESLRSVGAPLSLAPDTIRSSFVTANQGLSRDAMSVSCRKSTLVEVLVCLKSDLSGFEPCPQVAKRSCAAAMIGVPASTFR